MPTADRFLPWLCPWCQALNLYGNMPCIRCGKVIEIRPANVNFSPEWLEEWVKDYNQTFKDKIERGQGDVGT